MNDHPKKRFQRYLWRLLIGIGVLVVTAPLMLSLFLNWMCDFILVTQSSRGYTVSLAGSSFISTDVTAFHRQNGSIYKITHLVDDIDSNFLSNSRAFWSQDGALFVVWNKGDKSYLVLDCAQNTAYGTHRGKILLQRHGGAGQLVFDGSRDLEARSRHSWPWEESASSGAAVDYVKYEPEGVNQVSHK